MTAPFLARARQLIAEATPGPLWRTCMSSHLIRNTPRKCRPMTMMIRPARAVIGLKAKPKSSTWRPSSVRKRLPSQEALAPSATKTVEKPSTNIRAASITCRRSSFGFILLSTRSSSEVPVMKHR